MRSIPDSVPSGFSHALIRPSSFDGANAAADAPPTDEDLLLRRVVWVYALNLTNVLRKFKQNGKLALHHTAPYLTMMAATMTSVAVMRGTACVPAMTRTTRPAVAHRTDGTLLETKQKTSQGEQTTMSNEQGICNQVNRGLFEFLGQKPPSFLATYMLFTLYFLLLFFIFFNLYILLYMTGWSKIDEKERVFIQVHLLISWLPNSFESIFPI